jgi:F-type H+-transporting ATPase subunit epsilon
MIQLSLSIPPKVIVDVGVEKIIAEDINGSFCLLPNHIDCVRILIPSILVYQINGEEKYIGIDEGVLIKRGKEVKVAVKNAVYEVEMGQMKEQLEKILNKTAEDEKRMRTIISEMEIDFINKYVESIKK